MNRRQLTLQGGALVMAVAAGLRVQAAEHQHLPPDAALIDAATECRKTGELCSAHCTLLLEQGDRSMAECQRRVEETIAVCEALASLSARGSPLVPRMAAIVADACSACETECLKHEDHPPCKAMADACATCEKECRRVMK